MANQLLHNQVTDNTRYTILSDGTPLPQSIAVDSIAVTKSINKIPQARLVLLDGDIPRRDFPASNQEHFKPGAEITIRMGYRDERKTIFKGIVIKHGIKSQYEASSQLIVELKDAAVRMTVGRKNKYFTDALDSGIIEEIIQQYELQPMVETTSVTHDKMVQYNCTDWDFMVTRAEANGKVVFVDDGSVTIKAPSMEGKAMADLVYGENIQEFEAKIDAQNQVGGVTTRSWDFKKQSVQESDASNSNLPEQGNINSGELASAIGSDHLPYQHSGRMKSEEMQSWAEARMLRSRLAKIKGRIRVLGSTKIEPGNIVKLGGLGDRFNGKAFVSSVAQYYGTNAEWVTDIHIGLSDKWLMEQYDDVVSQPSAGLLPSTYGLQTGVVTTIDDPAGEDRVKIRIPMIDPEDDGVWARVSALDAGDNRGTFFRPEVDDEVIVGFIDEDPRNPVVLGMLNSSAKPAPITAKKENNKKGIITREELKLLFDDEKKSVVVETPNGNTVVLSDDKGSISLEDENGNTVTMDSSAITIKSAGDISIEATGNINLKGTNISNKANGNFKANGTGGAKITTSGIAAIKGSIVQIN